MRALRIVLVLDAAVLFLLGFVLIFMPHQVAVAFGFPDLPEGVHYIIGLWGCVLVTLSMGYAVAAQDPRRHVVWIQVGIARGALECLLGISYAGVGVVSFRQAGFGIVVAGLMAAAYAVLYPRARTR